METCVNVLDLWIRQHPGTGVSEVSAFPIRVPTEVGRVGLGGRSAHMDRHAQSEGSGSVTQAVRLAELVSKTTAFAILISSSGGDVQCLECCCRPFYQLAISSKSSSQLEVAHGHHYRKLQWWEGEKITGVEACPQANFAPK